MSFVVQLLPTHWIFPTNMLCKSQKKNQLSAYSVLHMMTRTQTEYFEYLKQPSYLMKVYSEQLGKIVRIFTTLL